MVEHVGWPFAVCAGRRRDYTVIAAPDFLVDAGAHGALADVAAPMPPRQPARLTSVQAGPQRLFLAYRTRTATRDDLVDGTEPADTAPADTEPGAAPADDQALRDEHGRPLRLIYGFVSTREVTAADSADLEQAHLAVRDALTGLLAEEETFQAQRTTAFPLHSRLLPPPVAPAADAVRPAPILRLHRPAHRAEPPDPAPSRSRLRQRVLARPLIPAVACAASVLAVGVVLAGRFLPVSGGNEPVPPVFGPVVSGNRAAQNPTYLPAPAEPGITGTGGACCRVSGK